MDWLVENWSVVGPIVGVLVGSFLPGPQVKAVMSLLGYAVETKKKRR